MGVHDKHLPRRDDNKGIGFQADVTFKQRKEIAAKQGQGTKADAKKAKARK